MSDLISRQDVIKMIQETEQMHPYKVPGNRESYGKYAEAWNDATCLIEAQMVFIPSVITGDTERKKGRWLWDEEDRCYCSECGNEDDLSIDGVYMMHDFCPNCGAEMSGGE